MFAGQDNGECQYFEEQAIIFLRTVWGWPFYILNVTEILILADYFSGTSD